MQNDFTKHANVLSGVAVGRSSPIQLYTNLCNFVWSLVGVQSVPVQCAGTLTPPPSSYCVMSSEVYVRFAELAGSVTM
eukprot:6172065-Pleurochrysis_carterae.AAC.3